MIILLFNRTQTRKSQHVSIIILITYALRLGIICQHSIAQPANGVVIHFNILVVFAAMHRNNLPTQPVFRSKKPTRCQNTLQSTSRIVRPRVINHRQTGTVIGANSDLYRERTIGIIALSIAIGRSDPLTIIASQTCSIRRLIHT